MKPSPPIPILEWVAATLGVLLTAAMLAAMAWQGINGNGGPPVIDVRVERIVPAGSGYAVEIVLSNRSRETAAAVELKGELRVAGNAVETATATVDYVPGQSSRTAGLFFTRDPRRHELRARVLGYAEP